MMERWSFGVAGFEPGRLEPRVTRRGWNDGIRSAVPLLLTRQEDFDPLLLRVQPVARVHDRTAPRSLSRVCYVKDIRGAAWEHPSDGPQGMGRGLVRIARFVERHRAVREHTIISCVTGAPRNPLLTTSELFKTLAQTPFAVR
jgi:hypothetical protein